MPRDLPHGAAWMPGTRPGMTLRVRAMLVFIAPGRRHGASPRVELPSP